MIRERAPDADADAGIPNPDADADAGIPNPDADADAGIPNPDAGVPGADSDCVPLGTETEESQCERARSLQHEALQQARDFARDNDLPMPNASTFVRAKVCNAPHMRCCAELGWRQDNRVRFPLCLRQRRRVREGHVSTGAGEL